jgi:hypothetical protein
LFSPDPEYVFLGHFLQVVASLLEYVPGMQGVHLFDPSVEVVPRAQGLQESDSGTAKKPAGHCGGGTARIDYGDKEESVYII